MICAVSAQTKAEFPAILATNKCEASDPCAWQMNETDGSSGSGSSRTCSGRPCVFVILAIRILVTAIRESRDSDFRFS